MKTKEQPTMKQQRTFTIIVEPEYFEVDCVKEGRFTFDAETLEGVSAQELTEHFYKIVSNNFKPKKVATIMWFEN